MCGRYSLATQPAVIREQFKLRWIPEIALRYNIAPTQPVPAIRAQAGERELVMLRWGLIPSWAKEPRIGTKCINARAETLESKPAFRDAFKYRRCLVLADGFFEWKPSPRGKQPYHIKRVDSSLFAFAGLWERWRAPNKDILETCVIIVTEANESLKPIHERMPVILEAGDYDLWLGVDSTHADELKALLKPYPTEKLLAYPVSTRVNTAAIDDASLIAALH